MPTALLTQSRENECKKAKSIVAEASQPKKKSADVDRNGYFKTQHKTGHSAPGGRLRLNIVWELGPILGLTSIDAICPNNAITPKQKKQHEMELTSEGVAAIPLTYLS